jgi:hypothetical protein
MSALLQLDIEKKSDDVKMAMRSMRSERSTSMPAEGVRPNKFFSTVRQTSHGRTIGPKRVDRRTGSTTPLCKVNRPSASLSLKLATLKIL